MYGYTIFHEKLMNSLITSIKNKKNSNAYIFEGPKGTFKHECAKLFAMSLCCTSSEIPCGCCEGCVQAKAQTNPDIKHIVHPSNKTRIDVDTIRSINEDAVIRPFSSKRKIYIIDEGDLMTTEAQNAFLKTFEEPPEYAVFIVVADNLDNLLQTIKSRATVVSFGAVEKKQIAKYISEKYPQHIEKEAFLLNYSEGIPGRIDEILSDEGFFGKRNEAFENLKILLNNNLEDAFGIEEYIKENTDSAGEIFDLWISFLRDLLVLQCGAFDSITNSDMLSELKSLSELVDEVKAAEAIKILIEGKHMIARFVKVSAAALRCALKIKQINAN